MKHIVHVSNDYEPLTGGITTHLKNLLPELGRLKLKVTLLVPCESKDRDMSVDFGEENIEGDGRSCQVVRASCTVSANIFSRFMNLTQATKFGLRWIEDHVGAIDLIHQHDKRATRYGASKFANQKKIPLVWTNHSHDFFGTGNFGIRLITRMPGIQPGGLIAVHKLTADQFRESGLTDCPVRYIPNGVDTRLFKPRQDRKEKAVTVVFYPQRMIARKGPMILAEAAEIIFKKNLNEDCRFWFAGSELSSNRDPKVIKNMRKKLQPFIQNGKVELLGNPVYEKMPGLYQKADIVALPLRIETENLSVFEAWASGTALIATTQMEENGYMENMENCLLVPNDNPAKLAEAIVKLVQNPELRKKLAENGRKLAEERFTWTRSAAMTAAFYDEILKGDAG